MHLNDDQLLEIQINDRLHLDNCESCQTRYNALISFREQLSDIETEKAPDNFWIKIIEESRVKEDSKAVTKVKRKFGFWQVGSLALAASFLFVFVFRIVGTNMELSEEVLALNKVAELIQQNRLVEQQLESNVLVQNTSQSGFVKVQIQITDIDRLLQSAYALELPANVKEKLWKERLKIMNHALSNKSEKPSFSI